MNDLVIYNSLLTKMHTRKIQEKNIIKNIVEYITYCLHIRITTCIKTKEDQNYWLTQVFFFYLTTVFLFSTELPLCIVDNDQDQKLLVRSTLVRF